jgi:two-component system sensor histidine kinase TrcS
LLVERLAVDASRIAQLVEHFTSLSQPSQSTHELDVDQVDLREFVDDVVRDVFTDPDRVTVALAEAAAVPGRAELLHQALYALLRNAALHTPRGTRVEDTPGGGATFCLRLPAPDDAGRSRPEEA